MPLTLDEYRIGALYTTMAISMQETGGGEGVKILVNEPYNDQVRGQGQYTKKLYFLKSKVPVFLRMIMPASAMELVEESWNNFPNSRTILTNPKFMGNNFFINVDTIVLEGYTHKQRFNVFGLDDEDMDKRKVIDVDISSQEGLAIDDLKPEEDPCLFQSSCDCADPPRGPLKPNWMTKTKPVVTVYKLIRAKFKWWGLQCRVEDGISNYQLRLIHLFHRKMFCYYDQFCGMTITDIRALEAKTKDDLERKRSRGSVCGSRIMED